MNFKSFPYHPFLIAAFEILTVYSININEVNFSIFLFVLITALVCSALTFYLINLIIKEKLLSALIVTTLGFLFFLYGRIIDIFIANPIFFGLYSTKLMILNTIYVIGFLCSFGLFLYLPIKK
jgi:hypothetical protein